MDFERGIDFLRCALLSGEEVKRLLVDEDTVERVAVRFALPVVVDAGRERGGVKARAAAFLLGVGLIG